MNDHDVQIAELRNLMAEREKKLEELLADYKKATAERVKREAEWSVKDAERKIELDAAIKKALDGIEGLKKDTNGISNSNALYSESYFYNSLERNMRFGGVDFDRMDCGVRRLKKMPDGKKLQNEFDIVMYNGDSIAIIEVKYKVREGDAEDLIKKDIGDFKAFFPEYENYSFYLGIAGMAFDPGTQEEAKKYGVGILRHGGESVIIEDAHVRAY